MTKNVALICVLNFFLLLSCGKTNSHSVNTTVKADTSASSLFAIHTKIFQPACAISGCHDGHFEPDFRTMQSTFYTTVFHPVTKNNAKGEFTYRVVPYEKAKSALFERITNCCFVNTNDRMPQDNTDVPLPENQIRLIGEWIDSGAKNIDGKTIDN